MATDTPRVHRSSLRIAREAGELISLSLHPLTAHALRSGLKPQTPVTLITRGRTGPSLLVLLCKQGDGRIASLTYLVQLCIWRFAVAASGACNVHAKMEEHCYKCLLTSGNTKLESTRPQMNTCNGSCAGA